MPGADLDPNIWAAVGTVRGFPTRWGVIRLRDVQNAIDQAERWP